MTAKNHRQSIDPSTPDGFSAALLEWYDRHHRILPWRVAPGQAAAGARAEPYRVWLSEIMLQQTTVEAVKPYFHVFTARWPGVCALAEAHQDDVMKAWAGLGYYSRARNLHRCARIVAETHGGEFPREEAGLKALPGIGDYTAAAIAAIAFGAPAIVVDGNVERVVTRFKAIATPLPTAKRAVRDFIGERLPAARTGDFAQAMMDLGATVCTPRRPACILCPLNTACDGLKTGDPQAFPVKAAKAAKPRRLGAAFVARRGDGAILLRRRGEKGLLAGMSEVPTTGWTARTDGGQSPADAPFRADWREAGAISHVFTHFELELAVYCASVDMADAPPGHWWSKSGEIHSEALPTVMKKVIEAAIPGATRRPR